MSYQNTGGYRATTATLDKKDASGVSLSGYPKQYSILDAIPGSDPAQAAITIGALRTMSDSAYQTRLEAFYTYLESENAGLNASESVVVGQEPYGNDQILCPTSVTVDDPEPNV
jgi:hypothetical protein